MKIDIKEIFYSKYAGFLKKFPRPATDIIFFVIKKLMHISEIEEFLEKHQNKKGIAFIDEIFELIDFSYSVSKKDIDKIPSEGKLVIISNHPLGGLDGLVLLKLISEIRSNVKIIVNDVLSSIENLGGLFLPVDILSGSVSKDSLSAIGKAVKNEEAIIVFPSGEVSRFGIKGIMDNKWNKGALFFATKYNAPILPVFIHARNSFWFYFVSLFSKKLSMLLLPHELFNKKGKTIRLNIGDPVPAKSLYTSIRKDNFQLKLLRKHHALIGRGKKGIFSTEKNIIHPVDRREIKKELSSAEMLGETPDGKKIMLLSFDEFPNVMKEISRLREVTFRKIGEGTGNKNDYDYYDHHYRHIVLWDENELDIVGAYRVGICREITAKTGIKGLYTSTLFNYSAEFEKILPWSVELGRSFIQAKYWNTYALDYLWMGIGSFLSKHPEIKFMFGPVSISNSYSEEAKNLIVHFYSKWFGARNRYVTARNKFSISLQKENELREIFHHNNYKEEFSCLKSMLKVYGYAVPALYKQYSDLCSGQGVRFHDFGVDYDFQNCVDGFIVVDVDLIKESKKERYIYPHLTKSQIPL